MPLSYTYIYKDVDLKIKDCICDMAFKLRANSTCLVVGGTSSGKSSFVRKVLRERKEIFQQEFTSIVWYYSIYQSWFSEVADIDFKEGFPDPNDITPGACLILDDLQSTLTRPMRKQLVHMFCAGAHHVPYFLIYIVQNIFDNTDEMRSVCKNAHYYVFMRGPRMEGTILKFAEQNFPRKSSFLLDAYEKATTRKPYSYLMVNLHPGDVDDRLKVLSKILPSEAPIHAFLPQ